MKVSIITVVYNREACIETAIESVLNQSYSPIEYIVIDGNSKDGTRGKIQAYGNRVSKFISEPDKGIYDALNKGISIATGDIIGILHSDDYFSNDSIVSKVANILAADKSLDAVYGDVCFVNKENPSRVLRYYSSQNFSNNKFEYGYMPAHPSFFCRKVCFDKFGLYRTDMKIGADLDLLLRFMAIHKINTRYIPLCTTKMSAGGTSTAGIKSILTINQEFKRSLQEHGFHASYFKLYLRYFSKWREFFLNKGKAV
jgi:glycosyltransferase involved in cell wall biosynthesis